MTTVAQRLKLKFLAPQPISRLASKSAMRWYCVDAKGLDKGMWALTPMSIGRASNLGTFHSIISHCGEIDGSQESDERDGGCKSGKVLVDWRRRQRIKAIVVAQFMRVVQRGRGMLVVRLEQARLPLEPIAVERLALIALPLVTGHGSFGRHGAL